MTKLDWFSVLKPKHPKARRKYDIRSSDLKLQKQVLINLFNRTKGRLTAQSGNEPFAHDGIPYVGLAQVIRNSSKNGRMRLEVVITRFGSDMPNSAIPSSKCTPTFPQVATGYINCTKQLCPMRETGLIETAMWNTKIRSKTAYRARRDELFIRGLVLHWLKTIHPPDSQSQF